MLPLASIGKRFLALLIDGLLLFVISRIVRFLPVISSIPLKMIFIALVYSTLFESSKYRGTLGKIVLGIEVTDTEGKALSWKTALLRVVGKVISTFILFIGFVFAFFTEQKQALHDLIAKSLVVESAKAEEN